jgi:hypothetical protein
MGVEVKKAIELRVEEKEEKKRKREEDKEEDEGRKVEKENFGYELKCFQFEGVAAPPGKQYYKPKVCSIM